MKKMTKRDWYDVLLGMNEVKANQGAVDFINREKELLAKKNSADRKPTAVQKHNAEIAEFILEILNTDKGMTISAIQKACEDCFKEELSNQKISALVTGLKKDGKVKRVEDKRKAYFYLA